MGGPCSSRKRDYSGVQTLGRETQTVVIPSSDAGYPDLSVLVGVGACEANGTVVNCEACFTLVRSPFLACAIGPKPVLLCHNCALSSLLLEGWSFLLHLHVLFLSLYNLILVLYFETGHSVSTQAVCTSSHFKSR